MDEFSNMDVNETNIFKNMHIFNEKTPTLHDARCEFKDY